MGWDSSPDPSIAGRLLCGEGIERPGLQSQHSQKRLFFHKKINKFIEESQIS